MIQPNLPPAIMTLQNGKPCHGIDPLDRAFCYGDGLFTSVRVRAGVPALWERHLQRLQQGALALAMDVDFGQLALDVSKQSAMLVNGTLKVILSRGIGARGYLPPQQDADVYLQLFPQTEGGSEVVAIESGLLTGQLGQAMQQLAGIKTLNRLEQVLLRQELATHGWQEGLVCDRQGMIVEGVYSNCFFRVAGMWWTPPITYSGIRGVMRAELIAQMQARQIPLLIQSLSGDQLDQIEALFFCNALSEIVPVATLAGRCLDVEAVKLFMNLLS